MGPLSGIRILDFGRFIAGPYCAALLAEFGAEVIRIEKPGGGEDRGLIPVTPDGDGAIYLQVNRNKRSLSLDPASPEGRDLVRRLVKTADVVVVNMPPQAVAALGLDYQTLKAIKSDIILANISGYGADGPWRDRLAFDSVGQAMCGAVYLAGEPGKPYRAPVSWVDMGTGVNVAFGVMVALRERDHSGQGQEVSGSLLATALATNGPALIEEAVLGVDRQPIGNRSHNSAPADIFRTRDGWIVAQALGASLFRRWARLMGEDEGWLDDPRFADDRSRGANSEVISERMQRWCAERTSEQALDALAAAKLPAGPLLSARQALEHPQVQAMGLLQPTICAGLDQPAPLSAAPVSLSRTPGAIRTRPPLAGEHTQAILADLGLAPDEIERLHGKGVL